MIPVSVIIPNYNHALFLKQRIESVLNQSFQDFEVIILDDSSTDNSRDIIELYRDHPKVNAIVYNNVNSGSPFKQWKRGIELASGDYIWIAESDDFSDSQFLEVMTNKFNSFDSLVVSYCKTVNTDSQSNIIGINDWAEKLDAKKWSRDYITNGINEIKSSFIYRNIIPNVSSVVFKKTPIQDFDFSKISQFKFCGDWYFWIHIFSKGEIAYSNLPLNYQRHHARSSTIKGNVSREIERFKEYFICIKTANTLTRSTSNLLNSNYDWIFEQIHNSIPYNLKTFLAFAYCSRSFSVFYRCLQTFTK